VAASKPPTFWVDPKNRVTIKLHSDASIARTHCKMLEIPITGTTNGSSVLMAVCIQQRGRKAVVSITSGALIDILALYGTRPGGVAGTSIRSLTTHAALPRGFARRPWQVRRCERPTSSSEWACVSIVSYICDLVNFSPGWILHHDSALPRARGLRGFVYNAHDSQRTALMEHHVHGVATSTASWS